MDTTVDTIELREVLDGYNIGWKQRNGTGGAD